MKEKKSDLKFLVLDVRDTQLPESSFDILIDKATSDAIVTESANLYENENFAQMNKEVLRLLNENGKWLIFSRHPPNEIGVKYFTMKHSEKRTDSVQNVYYFYVFEKSNIS
jgi:hypothetical protein